MTPIVQDPQDENSFVMQEDAETVNIRVDNLNVYVKRTDEGVAVAIWGTRAPDCDVEPVATTYAFFNDDQAEEGE